MVGYSITQSFVSTSHLLSKHSLALSSSHFELLAQYSWIYTCIIKTFTWSDIIKVGQDKNNNNNNLSVHHMRVIIKEIFQNLVSFDGTVIKVMTTKMLSDTRV